ncbi:uncharacterized protein LOC129714579 isoform X2 [Leucoraja erinacea]|uniref:uncharacterized protein LOC129714579 isoform X2 n=1 Tax=Leucoraja erinaceus TaxID=7782 RepID=UPI0024587188|nr:uncharacterized protein LOC129714579 isoform X2 [Leucoraja erinacea]
MKSEESDESPPADANASNIKGAAAMPDKQKNDGATKEKPSSKPTAGSQVKAKVGTSSSRPPTSSRTNPSQASKLVKKTNEQDPRAAKTAPRSGMSAHDKIMEKKMMARNKMVGESVAVPSSAGTNGSLPTQVARGATAKTLPPAKAGAKVKNTAQHASAASKKPLPAPAAAAAAVRPAGRPVKPSYSAVSRPNSSMATSCQASTGAVRKPPMSKQLNEGLTCARTAKPSVPTAGSKPEKRPPASNRTSKDPTLGSSQLKKIPSLEAAKGSAIGRTSKLKLPKPSDSSSETKHVDASVKTKLPVKQRQGILPDASVSKSLVGTVLPSTKTAQAIEKQPLSSGISSNNTKTLSENNVGRCGFLESRLDAESKATMEGPSTSLVTGPAVGDEVEEPGDSLTIENAPSPQGMKAALLTLDLAGENAPAEGTVAGAEAKPSVYVPAFEGEEDMECFRSVKLAGQLNKGEMNSDPNFEPGLCLTYIDKMENIGAMVGNEHNVPEGLDTVNVNHYEVQQTNEDDNMIDVGGDVALIHLEECFLPRQWIVEKDSALPCSEGAPSIVDLGTPDPTPASPPEHLPVIEDNVVLAPTLQNVTLARGAPLGSGLEDASSLESSSDVSTGEQVMLSVNVTVRGYPKAEVEVTPPEDLLPEKLSSCDQDAAFKLCELLAECFRTNAESQHPVGREDLPSGAKLGILPGDGCGDHGVSQASSLSGPDMAGKSSSVTSTPEELKDYNSSSGVESKSGKLESADDGSPPREICEPDLVEQDLGIHLERGDYEPETLPADDLLEGSSTEPMVSSDDEEHLEGDLETVAEITNQRGLEGIDNPVFEDKAATELKTESLSLPFNSPQFNPSSLQAVEETEELATAETPSSPGLGQLALQSCLLSTMEPQAGLPVDNQVSSLPPAIDGQSHGSPTRGGCPIEADNLTGAVPDVTLNVQRAFDLVEDLPSELADESLPMNAEVPGANHPMNCLDGELAKLQEMSGGTDNANGGCMQQLCYPLYEKNDNVLAGIMNEGDKTVQTHCVPWITPLHPPILSTIYEAADCEESRLEEDYESKDLQTLDLPCLEFIEDPSDRVLSLQIEPVEVVQQLINHTLLLSGDGVKLQSKVMVDKAELSKWTDLISPLDDSTASITSVTSFSPEDLSSSQGEWTVVELETHH